MYNLRFKISLTVFVCLCTCMGALAQDSQNDVPVIGAEIYIEPGQTTGQIDGWVHQLQLNGLTLSRIRLSEAYMHKPDNTWDYTLFDAAFKAGEKYGIKMYGNLAPATSFANVGGFKFPTDSVHLKSIANYIANVIPHFKQFTSCVGWVPINEPGGVGIPQDAMARQSFESWKNKLPADTYKSGGFVYNEYLQPRFLLDYDTWYITWLTDQIRKYDATGWMQINPHAIFANAGEYDFPAWRKNLTSLGGSAHASWHFGYFTRPKYALAMAANSEMLRSGAGELPWLMTELQGGNNTYSGTQPLCPTDNEVTQWFWTTIGKGSKGAMFWCMNPRASGTESGEWALLNFQSEPSDRLLALKKCAKTIAQHSEDLAKARVVESGVNILYIRQSLWIEKSQQVGGASYEGRNIGGVMKSALGYFETLTAMGLQTNLKEISEFDFSQPDYTGKTIILSHQVAIPSAYWQPLTSFIAKGGLLIADGLTGYYDEHGVCVQQTGFPLQDIFGGNIKEYKVTGNIFQVKSLGQDMPANLWMGSIAPKPDAKVISTTGGQVTGIQHNFGKGAVVWVPSLLGMGARIQDSYLPLCGWLGNVLKGHTGTPPFGFAKPLPGVLLYTLSSNGRYLTILINKTGKRQLVALSNSQKLKPQLLFANHTALATAKGIALASEETAVIKWN